MPTTTLPKYVVWHDQADNRTPYKFQQNIGNTSRVFGFRFEERRNKELNRARRLGALYQPRSEGE